MPHAPCRRAFLGPHPSALGPLIIPRPSRLNESPAQSSKGYAAFTDDRGAGDLVRRGGAGLRTAGAGVRVAAAAVDLAPGAAAGLPLLALHAVLRASLRAGDTLSGDCCRNAR